MGARFKTGPGLGIPPNALIRSRAWELLFVSVPHRIVKSSGVETTPPEPPGGPAANSSGLSLMTLDTAGPGAPWRAASPRSEVSA